MHRRPRRPGPRKRTLESRRDDLKEPLGVVEPAKHVQPEVKQVERDQNVVPLAAPDDRNIGHDGPCRTRPVEGSGSGLVLRIQRLRRFSAHIGRLRGFGVPVGLECLRPRCHREGRRFRAQNLAAMGRRRHPSGTVHFGARVFAGTRCRPPRMDTHAHPRRRIRTRPRVRVEHPL
ncbi:hypothetical protein GCM10010435_19680 [Winogradskya consettensis]|uniref:Uncharacterized protein n=1 Tax=Winogradskya consettensis TaxID=113560 RepID=A0A919VTE7_9ACTN|nr:hypothetical protein Aco04nite_59370 [Actinoplanes consettensis]